MTVRVRIAPSPTGNLHIGTARTAVFNWLFAKNQDGQFILRVEDTDLERSRPEFTDNILEGLDWLGLTWDAGPVFQSKRLDLYRQMVQTLLDRGLAYRCYCTPEELDEMRSQQKAKGQAPRYDNRHRDLTAEQIEAFEAEGRTAVIRFKIDDDREIVWNDLVRGRMVWKGSDLGGDMVVARASSSQEIGQPLYNLAVVVDDIDLRITHVIRGEDHIANTAKQILLYEAFEADIPEFAHTPLILNQSGQKLSKRDGVTSISDFKEMGFTAEALVNYMTLLGWSPPDNQEMFTLAEAASKFSFDRVNKAGAKFDWDKLDWLNSQYIHRMPVDQLTDALIPFWQKAGYTFDTTAQRPWLEALTALVGPSLTRLTDAIEMSRTFFVSDVEMTEAGSEQLEREGATAVLEAILDGMSNQQTLTEQEAQDLIKEVTKAQKVKKGLVMRSLRAALTGDVHGPDLIQSWVLLHQRGLDRTRLEKVLKVHVEEASALTGNPSTEQPKDTQTDASASPPGGATSASVTPDATTSQLDGIKNQIVTILSDLPEYVTAFVKDYQKPLVTVGLILAILVSLRVLVAVLDVLNGIPLVQPTFEIVGLSYSIWFVYRYLLSASTRSELSSQLEQLKQQVAGDKTPKN
ncbi:glutamate--tRNA ligase [Oxynema aestuarii AP17]|uniref:Glutamate--tRNA ligase n=1 Tax=Oxynema aestuarii AP17 TaxID=2064643 RepID=A0A6H1TVK3_9CYAN|nr:glutamate--tRNA ligase [Oxynema aestuarii AP17]RMH77582.1 MAG: glutamate--tRNA ligase [Cyanobacteria bacterium J007]